MATTLTVDQAVQRLIHSAARSGGNESRLVSVTPQNIDQRGNAVNTGIFVTQKSPIGSRGTRSSGHSRYSTIGDMAATTNRVSGDPYFLNLQRRGKNGGLMTGRGAEELNDGSSMRELFSTPVAGSVMDVQRCLKNFIVAQANRLSVQQEISAAKDREIEELRRENQALKNALRSFEKRLPTTNAAQQCDFSDILEAKHSTTQYHKSLPSQNDAEKNSATSPVPTLASGEFASAQKRDSMETNSEVKKTRKRTRCLVDAFVPQSTGEDEDEDAISGRLRSGRRRSTLEPEPKSQSKKRSQHGAERFSKTRRAQRRSTLRNGKPGSSKNRDEVQTPEWRILQVSAGGVLEGTENITDEAFSKRHQKCEVEERRVVRRDKMRQREELLKEKMIRAERHNQLAKHKRDRNDSESCAAAPDIDELEAIEICEHLPKLASPTNAVTPPSAKKRRKSKK